MSKNLKSKPKPKSGKKAIHKSTSTEGNAWWYKWSPLLLLGFAAIIFLQTRIQLLAIPIERDEGSFAYISHWLLRGKDLYTDMLDSKLPGLYAWYAFSTSVFGYNATGIHIGLFISNILAGIFFYLLLNEIFNRYVASISTAFFLLLIIAPNVNGFAAHATQLLLPFLLSGCWLFWKGIKENRLLYFFLSGLMIGASFTFKQQSAVFGILLALLWWPLRLAWNKNEHSRIPLLEWLMLGVGGLLPLLATLLYFQLTGRLDEFIFWTYEQPMRLSASMKDPWYVMLWNGINRVNQKFEMIYIIAAIGFLSIFFTSFRSDRKWFALLFVICSVLSVAIGVGYYSHYFVVAMPGIALCIGLTIYFLSEKIKKTRWNIGLAVAFIFLLIPLIARKDYYFTPDYNKIHQEAYNQNMFPEIEKLGRELRKRIPEGEKLAVFGSEPEVLVAAQREGCSKHLMVYSMIIDTENAVTMQDEYHKDITECDADYLVFDVFSSSWAPGFENLELHKRNMAWLEANMMLEGIAEYREGQPGLILWGEEARKHTPAHTYLVYVFKRKPILPS